jgi:hypothetical protein
VSLQDVPTDIAAALEPLTVEVPELQIIPGWNTDITPPAIDVFPSTPFQVGAGFGVRNKRTYWTVRAMVSTADPNAGQTLLLRFLDPDDPASVEVALAGIDATVDDQSSVSGFQTFTDHPEWLGCQWQVGVFT